MTPNTGDPTYDAIALLLIVFGAAVVGLILWLKGEARLPPKLAAEGLQPVIIRNYRGSQAESFGAFQRDVASMGAAGYVPTSQSWTPGQWGAGSFIVALLLCLILIGLIVFLFMLIVKPAGMLTVIYQRSAQAPNLVHQAPVVPDAAEGRQAIRRLYGV
jgi:hypothetical protein